MDPELFYNIPMHPEGFPANTMSVPVAKFLDIKRDPTTADDPDGVPVTFEEAVTTAQSRLLKTGVLWVVTETAP